MFLNRNMAGLLLALLLSFPQAGRSLHVLFHPQHHHVCCVPSGTGEVYAGQEEFCQVCELEYVPVLDPPGENNICVANVFNDFTIYLLSGSTSGFSGSHISLRAPPAAD